MTLAAASPGGRIPPGRIPPGAPDRLLARRAAAGDLGGFSMLYRRHASWVYRVALTMCRDRGDAEDVTQDVFVQVWRSLPSFREESSFPTWVRRICINRCIRTGRRPRAVPAEDVGTDLESDQPDPASAAVAADEADALHRAIAELPEPQRVALVLREFGQLSYEEVADVLDISLTAARARIHRGRLELVQRLGSESSAGRSREAG